jgi:hypothetical protein
VKQPNGLAIAAGSVLTVGATLEWYQGVHTSNSKKATKATYNLPAHLIAIAVLMIVMTFITEQAPDFGGPFALLVLVVALIRYSGVIGLTFNQTQGSTK